MTSSEIWKRMQLATEIVKSWPEWKRGILEQSSKPTVKTPRKPV